ncbi:recombinase family protein [Streptomyces monomycini]|uniref:recombinase family protein n=1 Tax=Streptomyces monomycini TaxID=371720 RepID=UPI000AF6A8FD|nr:recombinase family protein [Streptomyces monomycini]
MANLGYKRVSTDQQSTARQDLVLAEAGIEDPVIFEEEAGTSSRLHPLQRPKFGELLTYARPGDVVHVSEMFRLVRGNQHILDVLDVLHRDRLALRIHDGAFSAMDLTARHPRTRELLSTVKFMVQTLAAAGELQRDLQRELTYDGLRAAEAKGNKGGRRPALAGEAVAAVRAAYLDGRTIAALAREHAVSRGAIRTAVADLLPEHVAADEPALAPEPSVTLDMPGKVADFLRKLELDTAERAAIDQGEKVRRGQGYTLRITAMPAVHRDLLDRCQPLNGTTAIPAPARPAASTRTASTPCPKRRTSAPEPTGGLLAPGVWARAPRPAQSARRRTQAGQGGQGSAAQDTGRGPVRGRAGGPGNVCDDHDVNAFKSGVTG